MKLKKGQIIYIKKEKYIVLNMIEFKEDTWVWQEYEIVNCNTKKHIWLSIEPGDNNSIEYYIYEKYNGKVNENKIEIYIGDKKYKLYESGRAFVKGYFGNADVDINESCNFFDYICDKDKSIVSVEKWDGEREQSLGYPCHENEISITEEFDKTTVKEQGKSTDIVAVAVVIGSFVFIALCCLIPFMINSNSIKKYIEKSKDKYQYVTSVTNNENNKKARVYKSSFSTLDETVKNIIDGVPEGITEVSDTDESTEVDGIGIETKNEYAYVYKEDGNIYVQVSDKKYVEESGSIYHSSHRTYYYRTYSSNIKSSKYTSYAASARQSSINSRRSSGGGTSSGK